jgi:DNA-binding MarR family transcriptional regulator
MHNVFFGLKRGYYATLGLTRRTLRRMGLTAARFDMLYAIHRKGKYSSSQRDLRRKLGVCASVTCRMLQALEAIGYVERRRMTYDRRQRRVTLTIKGRARILRAIRQFIGWGYAELALHSALEPEHWHSEWRTQDATLRARRFLELIRRGFGDLATLLYPGDREDRLPRRPVQWVECEAPWESSSAEAR